MCYNNPNLTEKRRSQCFDAAERQPVCDVGKVEDERTQAFNTAKAAYDRLEAIPGHPWAAAPMDMRPFEKEIDRRMTQEDGYASDCDRGQASACIQYQEALQQDRDQETQRHEDFERSLDLDPNLYLMTIP